MRHRPLGLRQVDADPHPGRARRLDLGRGASRRRRVHGPGPDRGMVFQGYTLFPWLTVRKNVMFGLEVHAACTRTRRRTRGRAVDRAGRPEALRRCLPAPALRRHEAARGHRPRARQSAAHPADGRALRRARRPDPRADAGVPLQIWKHVDVTIVFITHDLDEAVYLADRIVVLDANPGACAR